MLRASKSVCPTDSELLICVLFVAEEDDAGAFAVTDDGELRAVLRPLEAEDSGTYKSNRRSFAALGMTNVGCAAEAGQGN